MSAQLVQCDVAEDEQIARRLWRDWRGPLMAGSIFSCTAWRSPLPTPSKAAMWTSPREAYRVAMDVSAYSFLALARACGAADDGRRGAL